MIKTHPLNINNNTYKVGIINKSTKDISIISGGSIDREDFLLSNAQIDSIKDGIIGINNDFIVYKLAATKIKIKIPSIIINKGYIKDKKYFNFWTNDCIFLYNYNEKVLYLNTLLNKLYIPMFLTNVYGAAYTERIKDVEFRLVKICTGSSLCDVKYVTTANIHELNMKNILITFLESPYNTDLDFARQYKDILLRSGASGMKQLTEYYSMYENAQKNITTREEALEWWRKNIDRLPNELTVFTKS